MELHRRADTPEDHLDYFVARPKPIPYPGIEAPRRSSFRNRLNVAISRARCLAYLVCTDELLDTRARTVEDMRLIATLNAFVEYLDRQHPLSE